MVTVEWQNTNIGLRDLNIHRN